MILGMRNSRISKKDIRVFQHNDMQQLDQLLTAAEHEGKVKIIVFESVYSMSGTIAPTHALRSIANKHGAFTFIDEVHGVGLYGARGGGICQRDGVEFDIVSGTLGKAIGVHGGYIAASKLVIDCIRSFAPNFIFTTSLPPAVLAGGIASIKYIKTHSQERRLHQQHV
jgi:5-aminolevulinate synthase